MNITEVNDIDVWEKARLALKEKWGSGYDIVQLSVFENDENDLYDVKYKAIHYTVASSDDRPYKNVIINRNFEIIAQ